MSYIFYENQIECANKIVEMFTTYSYIILCSQMQSGKSGTYLYAALSMIHNKTIDNIIIVSGVSDKTLRQQCNDDKEKATESFFENKVMFGGELKRIEKSIHVLFSQDFSDMTDISENTLIIWDESHYAQSISNRPNKWFDSVGLSDVLNGKNLNILTEKNIHILSVSATPFSETIDNEKSSDKKGYVFLKPDNSYRGLRKFIENNKVKESIRIDQENKNKVKEILGKLSGSKKYIIMRIHSKNDILDRIIEELNFERVSFDMNSEFDLNDKYLSKSPERTTVILIKGKCRLGYVVCKKFVGLVYETSMDSKADSQFQGLWGRMCGTPSERDNFEYMPEVYVTKDNILRGKKYAEFFEQNGAPIIDHSRNVPKQSIRTRTWMEREYHPSIPIKFENIPDFELKDIKVIFELLVKTSNTHTMWNGNNETQIQELKDMLTKKMKISERNMLRKSYLSRRKKMVSSYNEKGRNFNFFDPRKEKGLNLMIWMKYEGNDEENGNYFMWWTKNQDEEILKEMKQDTLPYTTGREAFSITTEFLDDEIECNGGQTYHLPKESCYNRKIMKIEIFKCVKRTHDEGFTSEICSQYDSRSKKYKGIKFDKSVWTEENIDEMFKEIESDFEKVGVKITINKIKQKGRKFLNFMSYSKIYW